MSEDELRDELERASAHLRPHADAQAVWDLGIRARRRNRAFAVGGVVAAAAATVIGGMSVQAIDSTAPDQPPATNPTPPDESDVKRGRIPLPTKDQVEPAFGVDDLASAPWDSASSVRSWDPEDPVPLDEDPVEHAGVAVIRDEDEPDTICVLGDDGRWRSVDLSGLELSTAPGASQVPASVSLSPDGTRLALGQTDGAVVVDLTTGERTTYAVAGLGAKHLGRDVAWSPDSETLYVDSVARRPGRAIDLPTGEIGTVPFAPALSAFLADGRAVEAAYVDTGMAIRVYDAQGRLTSRLRGPYPDLADAAAGGDRVALQRYGARLETGVLITDSDVRPQRFLPVTAADWSETGVIGWRGDDTVLFVVHRQDPDTEDGWRSYVLAWNVESGRITRVADGELVEMYSVAADHLP